MDPNERKLIVPSVLAGRRLDRVLEELVPDSSRAFLQKLVRRGQLRLNGKRVTRSNVRVDGKDVIVIRDQQGSPADREPLAVRLLFRDEHMVVVDKPAGLVTHPNESFLTDTVSDQAAALTGPLPTVYGADRAGIVHRLDRETSGLLLLARTERALRHLKEQFRRRQVKKSYLALVHGMPRKAHTSMTQSMGSHPDHKDMQVVRTEPEGKTAETQVLLREAYGGAALLECRPTTGRRHQIRVHLRCMDLQLVGDSLYRVPARPPLPEQAPRMRRQALHASSLGFVHPASGLKLRFLSPPPVDFCALRDWLRAHGA